MQSTISETLSVAPSFIAEIEESEKQMSGVKVHKWTQKEYYQMAELGFFHGKRVELIEGEIIEMSPMNKPHATAIRIILGVLRNIFVQDYIVDSQLPMSFSKTNEPEPDVAVIKGGVRDFSDSHPKTAELIIEVSDSTLRFDRTVKANLYAQNKIHDYWILNLRKRCLEVYRHPKKDKKLGYIYTESRILTEDDEVSPLIAPEAKIKISDILP
jgi:Uma2 family endonuclease